ncbi:universal stress protein [Phenylobacterium sp.]|uniref:universal stress protein n=1 Tax=Phenylobacterium sp. TaxID=1871053 RepID=UPI0025F2F40F|nr:universal stress protein [Phenylobacterium sp.]
MHRTLDRPAETVVVRPNTYATILVHAEPAQYSAHRVEVAAHLARDLGAHLIGLGAETFDPALMSGPFTSYAAGEWIGFVQEQITKELSDAEVSFRRDAAGADLEWRAVQDYPHHALVLAARAADLVVVSPRGALGPTRSVDPAEAVMTAGRPVLIVPEGRTHLHGMSVVVAWKDTREGRRALTDALPFLQRAQDVIVLSVVAEDARQAAANEIDDVVGNLKRHGVEARPLVSIIDHDGVTAEIERVAHANGADLIVAGAYGHTRMREWAFGGVTDDFLNRPDCFVLLSH